MQASVSQLIRLIKFAIFSFAAIGHPSWRRGGGRRDRGRRGRERSLPAPQDRCRQGLLHRPPASGGGEAAAETLTERGRVAAAKNHVDVGRG